LSDFKALNSFDAAHIEQVLKSNMEANQLGLAIFFNLLD